MHNRGKQFKNSRRCGFFRRKVLTNRRRLLALPVLGVKAKFEFLTHSNKGNVCHLKIFFFF
uniref:Uncharacterized protein n=1 Tax=Anguilla anguilla TaxID=7936 RepID=A0A0E9X2R4_ANGAN